MVVVDGTQIFGGKGAFNLTQIFGGKSVADFWREECNLIFCLSTIVQLNSPCCLSVIESAVKEVGNGLKNGHVSRVVATPKEWRAVSRWPSFHKTAIAIFILISKATKSTRRG